MNKNALIPASAMTGLTPEEQQRLVSMFALALINADKQLTMMPDGTAYIKTGDIPAQWLRDSSAQMRPHLFYAKDDPLAAMTLKAVIERQALYIATDPYANAFTKDFKVWERKFELDSLSYPVLLAWTYWKVTGDDSIFTPAVKHAFTRVLETMETEQDHDGTQPGHTKSDYFCASKPIGYTGMIWSGFRPSDDRCRYNFLIPANMQAVQALTALKEMETHIGRKAQAARAEKLAGEVHAGIEKFGIVNHPKYGKIYAYETDGLGHHAVMDDANLPSLLSIPCFGYKDARDPVYQATRRFVLSDDNPYFYKGKYKGEDIYGVGRPHTETSFLWSLAQLVDGRKKTAEEQKEMLRVLFNKKMRRTSSRGMVWPLAQLAQGLTTQDRDEKIKVIKMLLASDSGDHSLHESYMPDNPLAFSRKDFGWPNALLVEFIHTFMHGEKPLPMPPSPDAAEHQHRKPNAKHKPNSP